MKVKTSVTLSEDIVAGLKRAMHRGESRSETIERLLRQMLAAEARHATSLKDIEIINRHSDALNAEALDALEYQVEP